MCAAGGLAAIGAPVAAKPSVVSYHGKYADVDASWSREAAAVPHLVQKFRSDFAKQKLESIRCGKLESDVRVKTGSLGIKCQSSTKVTTSGRTPRLLSLARSYWAFTGGAHGNGATTGLLWDRSLNREISFASLFLPGSDYQKLLRGAYCAALDTERRKRRGKDYRPGAVAEFDSCPKLSDLAMFPASSRRGGKLDRIHLVAAPYLAGSFAEGEYDIALPVTGALTRLLKPQYRSSFEAQRQ